MRECQESGIVAGGFPKRLTSMIEPRELEILAKRLRVLTCKAGTKVIRANASSDSIALLLSGTVEILGSSSKRRMSFGSPQPGALLRVSTGWGGAAPTEIAALSSCRVGWLDGEKIEQTLADCPSFAVYLCKQLAEMVTDSHRRTISFATEDVASRLATQLRSLGKPETVRDRPALVITKLPTHSSLARLIGSSREVVTRHLCAMQNQGKIFMDGRMAIIPLGDSDQLPKAA